MDFLVFFLASMGKVCLFTTTTTAFCNCVTVSFVVLFLSKVGLVCLKEDLNIIIISSMTNWCNNMSQQCKALTTTWRKCYLTVALKNKHEILHMLFRSLSSTNIQVHSPVSHLLHASVIQTLMNTTWVRSVCVLWDFVCYTKHLIHKSCRFSYE